MVLLTEEHHRQQATRELAYLQALRVSVPACFDDKAGRSYEQREEALLDLINAGRHAAE